jgi:endoglucanase
MDRRTFVKTLGAATAVAAFATPKTLSAMSPSPVPIVPRKDPRWRGFNLPEMTWLRRKLEFQEQDFELMAQWGFNFARIPLSYWNWAKPEIAKWKQIDEREFARLDRAVALGRRYGIHLNLNLHRIPGYCINERDKEPADLFVDTPEKRAVALDAAVHHWEFIAKRYRDIPVTELSFDLINEPPFMEPGPYVEVARALVAAIRGVSPDRLVIADGINIGNTPVYELADLGIWQSTRGYEPKPVSHFQADWVPEHEWAAWPEKHTSWPITAKDGTVWNKETLRTRLIGPWKKLEAMGCNVHVGEWGAHNRTPHAIVLAWMQDYLELWQEAGWGWALWNLRGDFGVLNSGRDDVVYESFRGMKLDRRMLELLIAH